MSKRWTITVCLLFIYWLADANEIPFLERTVTIQIREERIDEALRKIALQGGFTFSYNPSIIPTEKVVSVNFQNKTIREILDQLFAGSIQYKERGRYVILTRAEASSQKERVVGGYILDDITGKRLENVTIYDPVSLSSAVTDSYGYFEIEIKDPMANITLVINKQNYSDTLLVIPPSNLRLLKIPIRESTEKIATLADSVGQKIKRFWRTKIMARQDINMVNVSDTLYRKLQFSVFPFIGTNHKLSGNVINDYSFNLYGGYSLGVRKFELGGLFNVNRGDVGKGQVAGLINAVGGNVTGIQFAGLFNIVQGSDTGAQFAGLVNMNWNGSKNFGAAGLANFSKETSSGVKFGGLINGSLRAQRGWHTAGLINFSLKQQSSGVQLAGLVNFAGGGINGGQLGGLINVSLKDSKGAQLGGLVNISVKRIQGAQISGLINYARKVKGVQLGFLNVADSVQGVQIGFLSFALKGYHTIEVSADEVFYTNLAFRTGTRKFYNILTTGMQPSTTDDEETLWSFGYGVGTLPKINRWLYLNADVTSNQIVKGKIEAVHLLNKIYLGVDIRATKKISFTIGATLNSLVTDANYEYYPEIFTDFKPSIVYDHTTREDINWKWWWGGKIGVRFL
jgi:hypothetical protein